MKTTKQLNAQLQKEFKLFFSIEKQMDAMEPYTTEWLSLSVKMDACDERRTLITTQLENI